MSSQWAEEQEGHARTMERQLIVLDMRARVEARKRAREERERLEQQMAEEESLRIQPILVLPTERPLTLRQLVLLCVAAPAVGASLMAVWERDTGVGLACLAFWIGLGLMRWAQYGGKET